MLQAAKEEIPTLPMIWGESVLPLAADPALLENRIWGKSRVAENSRQGFQLRASTLRWASSEVKSRTALGIRGTLYDERVGSRCTGKERDSESNLDNFGARYYGSSLGRFMTPDWATRPTAVPYAVFGDPQSLNLYNYVRNDPVSRADADGHEVDLDNKKKADRDETQRRLVSNTSKAEQKLFKSVTDPKTGKTTLALTGAAKSFKGTHTVAFTRLADAIGQKNVVSVGIHDTFTDAKGTHATPLGGITVGPAPGIAGNATTTLNRNGLGAGDMSVVPGTTVPAPTNIVAAHEVMGHGLEIQKGGDPTEHHVWEIENQMRQEQGLPPRPPE